MVIVLRCVVFLLLSIAVKTELLTTEIKNDDAGLTDEEVAVLLPDTPIEEYIRHLQSMLNSYRKDLQNNRMVLETNAMKDTRYKTWKRNADLINSLLALPKGMNDAGR